MSSTASLVLCLVAAVALLVGLLPRVPKLTTRLRAETLAVPTPIRQMLWWTIGANWFVRLWAIGAAATFVALAVFGS